MAELRIADQAGTTDVGRQRSTNEDSLVVSPPFFAVADGMGGAKAGEVASGLAVKVFEEHEDSQEPAEAQLSGILQEANRRIFELATSDESRRGMGTTLTAAKLDDGNVSLAHVGDSRAYRLRDGALEQITKDHSLVAELERSGQISAEAAEHHPQRSIITRALGPEPDVEVDTYTVPGRPGDVFLLCSDGLTGMVSDDEVATILRNADSLQEAADELVRAANQSGGKDNITVVLFRLEEVADEAEAGEPAGPAPDETVAGGIQAAEVAAAAPATETDTDSGPAAPATRDPGLTVAEPARPRPRPRRRSRARLAFRTLLVLLVLAAVGFGLYTASRQVYFVGTNDAGLVTLYRGLPYELPFGIELYEEEYASSVPARAIPRNRRSRVLNHEWRGHDDAVDLMRAIERGQLT
jgi:serine/threonine protein phosphatase PrpC